MKIIDFLRTYIRKLMDIIAKIINRVFVGKITPNQITLFGLFMHFPIAYFITTGSFVTAGLLLLVFGLFDALDGALARLQNKASSAGMFLDASTDRFKEVLIYTGSAYWFVNTHKSYFAVWAVVATGASLSVSYIKAKGETAVAGGKLSVNEINRLFQDGLARFEIRMTILIIGLLTNNLHWSVAIVAVLSSITAVERLVKIYRKI